MARTRTNIALRVKGSVSLTRCGKLIILCGLPGSGKTTLAKQLEVQLSGLRFCPDEWMQALAIDLYDEDRRSSIEKLQWEMGQKLLSLGATVIIEWGTWGRSERDTLRIGAKALGAQVELHVLTASARVLFERIQKRGMEDPPIKWEDVENWLKVFQIPDAEEMALFDKSFIVNTQELNNF